MRAPFNQLALPFAMLLAGCASGAVAQPQGYTPPFGSNPVFNEEVHAAPGHELIVADLHLPPNAVGEAHYHLWEEYLYVIEGSALVEIEGMEPREIVAGETFVIPRLLPHTPKAGPQGIRAIIVRVHDEGDPLSVPMAVTAGE